MIVVLNRQRRVRLDRRRITRLGNALLREQGHIRKRIHLVFTDNDAITRLNVRFLGRKGATDVIAFPITEGVDDLFGEVVVSAERARHEARARGIPIRHELLRYAVHGILHLFGYRDDTLAQRRKMWTVQEKFLSRHLHRFRGEGRR